MQESPTLKLPKQPPDWFDTFTGQDGAPQWTARQALGYALNHPPFWFLPAMKLRNILVKPFGLTTENDEDESNDNASLLLHLPIVEESQSRFECGLFDKHLTFSILVEKSNGKVSMTTNIWFKHFMGRVYLITVMPFHKLIVHHCIKKLENPKTE